MPIFAILGDRKRLGSKPRPELIERLVAKHGEENENAIKKIVHQEFNKNSGNRRQEMTVSVFASSTLAE